MNYQFSLGSYCPPITHYSLPIFRAKKGNEKLMKEAIKNDLIIRKNDERRKKAAAAQRKKRWQEMKAEIKKKVAEEKALKKAEVKKRVSRAAKNKEAKQKTSKEAKKTKK